MNETVTRSELTHYYDKNGRRVKLGDWICFLWWVTGSDGTQFEKYIYGRILRRHGKLIFKYRDDFSKPGKGFHERRLDALNFDSESEWEIIYESCYGYGVYMPWKYELSCFNMEKEARIVKIEKGLFMVEYRDKLTRFAEWKIVDKQFKTRTKAEQYIREKIFV